MMFSKGLVTNYGEGRGATQWEGGVQVKFYPYENEGRWKKFLAMLKGVGHTMF